MIPAGGTTGSVAVGGVSAGATAIRVSAPPNIAEKVVNVTVTAPGSILLSATTAALGTSALFSVTLGSPAPAGGVVITLSTNKPLTATISPVNVYIPGGAVTPAAQPRVTGMNIGLATITATAPGYGSASQSVSVPATITVSPTSLSIAPGGTGRLFLALSNSAPWGPDSAPWTNGITVQLSSSNPNVARVQSSVDFYPDGSHFTTILVLVNGISPGTAVITASALPFIPAVSATVTVTGPGGSQGSIAPLSGTPQSAIINTVFSSPLVAVVKDSGGNPVSGALVTFNRPGSGATGTFAGGVSTATTNASGVATSAALTANATPGSYVVTATVAGAPQPANFLLTNTSAGSGAVVLPANLTVGPNQSVSFPVTLSAPAPAGGVTVMLTSSDVSKATVTPASITFAAGATTSATQPKLNGVNFGSTTVNAMAPGYSSAAQSAQVRATLAFTPPAVTLNTGAQTLTLTLSAPAPASGLTVSLSSSNTGVATVSSSVSFPANSTSVSVPLTGVSVGSATITASSAVPNVTSATAAVTIKSGSDINIGSGVTVVPGETKNLPINLTSAAPAGGVALALTSSDTSKVTVFPTSIFIPAGATAPGVLPQVTGVSLGTANIIASAPGLAGDVEVVRVASALLGPANATIARGTTQNLAFTLSPATPAALTLSLKADSAAIASVPATIVVPANGTTVVVPVTGLGMGVTNVRITAPSQISEKVVSVAVVAPNSITLSNISAELGQSKPFPVVLGTPAPQGGVVVTLSSSNALTLSVSPSTVFVPAGATTPSVQPQITGVNIGKATISASAPGYSSASQSISIFASVTISPASQTIKVGSAGRIYLVLSASAPWGPSHSEWSNGFTVQISSSNPNVAWLRQSVDFYPDGSAFATIMVFVNAVSPGTTVIRASALPYIPEVSTTVTVVP